ncbi:hypothetical protein BN9982_1390003 [Mycobacterium tuberculosis]|nr:hypothetical protein BN9982_1390003 [Mycobacterium tuberculosis]
MGSMALNGRSPELINGENSGPCC